MAFRSQNSTAESTSPSFCRAREKVRWTWASESTGGFGQKKRKNRWFLMKEKGKPWGVLMVRFYGFVFMVLIVVFNGSACRWKTKVARKVLSQPPAYLWAKWRLRFPQKAKNSAASKGHAQSSSMRRRRCSQPLAEVDRGWWASWWHLAAQWSHAKAGDSGTIRSFVGKARRLPVFLLGICLESENSLQFQEIQKTSKLWSIWSCLRYLPIQWRVVVVHSPCCPSSSLTNC